MYTKQSRDIPVNKCNFLLSWSLNNSGKTQKINIVNIRDAHIHTKGTGE